MNPTKLYLSMPLQLPLFKINAVRIAKVVNEGYCRMKWRDERSTDYIQTNFAENIGSAIFIEILIEETFR